MPDMINCLGFEKIISFSSFLLTLVAIITSVIFAAITAIQYNEAKKLELKIYQAQSLEKLKIRQEQDLKTLKKQQGNCFALKNAWDTAELMYLKAKSQNQSSHKVEAELKEPYKFAQSCQFALVSNIRARRLLTINRQIFKNVTYWLEEASLGDLKVEIFNGNVVLKEIEQEYEKEIQNIQVAINETERKIKTFLY
jgi:hypothetical protein